MTGAWRWLAVVAVLALTGCGDARPTEVAPQQSMDGSVTPSGDVPPASNGPAAADCAPPARPGPADAPPDGGGDLMDLSDYGGARWRLCLTDPVVASVEGRAWCLWTEDRSSVTEIQGNPTHLGELDYDAWVSLERGQFQLSTTDRARGGSIATYVPGPNQPVGEATDAGRVGQLAFDLALQVDPEAGPPAGAPPRSAGAMRWICGDAPPPA